MHLQIGSFSGHSRYPAYCHVMVHLRSRVQTKRAVESFLRQARPINTEQTITRAGTEVVDPFDTVGEHMTSSNVRYAMPEQPLSSAASKLDKVTGLAVVDSTNTVVGVVSIKDINRLKKQGVILEEALVGAYMSKPPIVVQPNTKVAEAAALMLAKKIHRLPVVDEDMKLIGITSRTDLFRRLMTTSTEGPAMSSLDALSGFKGSGELKLAFQKSLDEKEMEDSVEDTWVLKYLYDGECSLCRQLMSLLKSKDGDRGQIKFVNIASMTYTPTDNDGITYEEAMETIHVIKRDGTIIKGPDALKLMYDTVGFGWLSTLAGLPIIEKIVEWLYEIVSKYRLPVGKQFDSLLALKRMNMTNAGVEHCVDDEEACEAEW
jgi:CBS domain-containing protein/predicted DCC family thiol-disulfide oxidoreductase YuxK